MLVNNTIESSRRPGIPGPHRPDLKWYKDALDGKSDVGHVHTKKEIEDFEHNHDGRYYRKDLNELDVILSGNGTPNFNQGDDGDYYIDELNEDMYVKEGDAWRLLIHLKGDPGIDGYTPIKGVDYWTKEDQNKIVSEVESTIKDKRDELDQHAEELKEEISEDLTALTDSKVKELEDATADLIEEVTSLELQKQIEALETENQKQQEELDMLNSEYTEKELEGESVVVKDGLPKSKISVKGNGNSYQETTEGYQVLDLEKYYYSEASSELNSGIINIEKGVLKMDGTKATAQMNIRSPFLSVSTGDIIPAGTYYVGVNLNGYYTNDTSKLVQIAPGIKEFTEDYILSQWFTTCAMGSTRNVTLLISKDTSKTTYEPFTNGVATPNTNHKQDIEVIDGVNLLDYSDFGTKTGGGITLEYTEDGYLVGNGTQTANWLTFWSKEIIDLLEDGETYTIKAEDYKSGLVNTSFYCQVAAYKEDGTRVNYFVDKNNATFTVDKSTYVRYVVSIAVGDKAITLNNDKNRFMLYKGTDNKPYLPCGHIGLIQRGKNRLKFKETTTQTSSGLTGTANVDGSFKLNGTTTGAVAMGFNLEPYKVKGTHRASGYTKDGLVQLYWKDKNGTVKYKEIRETTPINFEEGDTLFQIFCWTNVTGKTYNNETFYLQLEEGSVATPFEPPVEPIVKPIDLNGNSLAENDNAEISVSGSVKANKVMKEYVFTGDENFSRIANGNGLYYFFNTGDILPDNASMKAYCNYFKNIDDIWELTEKVDGFKFSSSNLSGLNIMTKNYATVADFKAFLKEKYESGSPVKILYETTNPTTIDLPSIEPIELFEGTNIFELVTNLGTTLAVTYKVSNKKKILNLEERISALESAVIGG